MLVDDLRGRRIAIWGYGREGRAALRFLRERAPESILVVMDDVAECAEDDAPLIRGRAAITEAITGFDVVVKSPGVSLYDPLVQRTRAQGVHFTSLLNLWFADRPTCRTICVTGTKGKSTTSFLIEHILRCSGHTTSLAGNIGVAVTDISREGIESAAIEVSSLQAADFTGTCDIAVLTSLSQEHLDWHGSIEAYHRDKLNLLRDARHAVVPEHALKGLADLRREAIFRPISASCPAA